MKTVSNRSGASQGAKTAVVAVAAAQARPGGALDARLGVAVLKDRRVPITAKVRAVGLGVLAMMVVNILELPVDALVNSLLLGMGLPASLMFNGAETIVGATLASAIIAPHVTPKSFVQTLRDERANA